jgi:hypothetical protein
MSVGRKRRAAPGAEGRPRRRPLAAPSATPPTCSFASHGGCAMRCSIRSTCVTPMRQRLMVKAYISCTQPHFSDAALSLNTAIDTLAHSGMSWGRRGRGGSGCRQGQWWGWRSGHCLQPAPGLAHRWLRTSSARMGARAARVGAPASSAAATGRWGCCRSAPSAPPAPWSACRPARSAARPGRGGQWGSAAAGRGGGKGGRAVRSESERPAAGGRAGRSSSVPRPSCPLQPPAGLTSRFSSLKGSM